MKIPKAMLGSAGFGLTGARARAGLPPARIEVPRYMGTWRVLGCMENTPAGRLADATESYSLTGENRLNVIFSWREGSLSAPLHSREFRGRILKDPSRGIWKMIVAPMVAAPYIVIDVAKDYSWAAVAHPSRKFGWILARSTRLPDQTWVRILSRFSALGYDTSRFLRVPQLESAERPGS
jgi:apolipoprotein D and lipocalin family protein